MLSLDGGGVCAYAVLSVLKAAELALELINSTAQKKRVRRQRDLRMMAGQRTINDVMTGGNKKGARSTSYVWLHEEHNQVQKSGTPTSDTSSFQGCYHGGSRATFWGDTPRSARQHLHPSNHLARLYA